MEAQILLFFEELRSPALTWFFGALSFLGEAVTVGVVILLLYWLIGGRTGEQLLFTALSSAAFNAMMKAGVMRPRPYAAGTVERLDVDTPLFTTRNLGDNLSFPSGHAQATSSALFTGAMRTKRWKALSWLVAVPLLFLVCCSRLYFGVHYPTDLIAGTLFGLLVALFWQMIFTELYSYRYYVLMGFAVVVLLALPLAPEGDFITMAGMLAGGAFFLPLVSFLKYDGPQKRKRRLLRIPAGLLCAGVIFAATLFFPEGAAFSLLKWFLLTGAGTFLAQVCFKILRV